jgi:hypothetical protein
MKLLFAIVLAAASSAAAAQNWVGPLAKRTRSAWSRRCSRAFGGTFKKEVMNDLADLGEKMGADPASWTNGVPD